MQQLFSLIQHPRFQHVIGPSRYHDRQRMVHVQGGHEMTVRFFQSSQTPLRFNVKDPDRSVISPTDNVVSRRMNDHRLDPVLVGRKDGEARGGGYRPQSHGSVSSPAGQIVPDGFLVFRCASGPVLRKGLLDDKRKGFYYVLVASQFAQF